jgi:uncharacterized protein YjbI with pentapeptide repeats
MAAISQATLTTTLKQFKGTSLNDRAVFNVTDFSGLDFTNLQVTGAKFLDNSNFTNCIFKNTQMRGTYFFGTNVTPNGCLFNNTQWDNVNCYSTANTRIPQVFTNCIFTNCRFFNCDMSNSIFIDCVFDNPIMRYCNFSNSVFYDPQFIKINKNPNEIPNIIFCNFKGCLFESTNLAQPSGTTYMTRAAFYDSNFEAASFVDIISASSGDIADYGLQFYRCNLNKVTMKFRNQAAEPVPHPIDKYLLSYCKVGNSVLPYVNPPTPVHIIFHAEDNNDIENAVTFDRNVFP